MYSFRMHSVKRKPSHFCCRSTPLRYATSHGKRSSVGRTKGGAPTYKKINLEELFGANAVVK